jgi:hypothetical protein
VGLLAALTLASSAWAGGKPAPAPAAPPVPDLKADPAPAKAPSPAPAAAAPVATDGGAPDLAAGQKPAEDAAAKPAEAKAAPLPAAAKDEQFDGALAKHFKGQYVAAAAEFYAFIRGSAKTADRYEWAEHFLSMDLDALGFKQAALEFEVFVSEERARPEVLPDSLQHIEELINANPYPHDLVEDELLHGTDFGPLPARSRSFVSYYQGLVDYRLGMTKWGDKRFGKVEGDSPYAAKVRYLKAVYRLVHDRDDAGAKADFTALAKDESAPRTLRNQAYMALARLAYEAKQYQESYDLWGSVKLPELDPGRAPIYLERAWNLYRLKKYGDAMGLLYALEAPTFHDVFLPDKYLLRSLIYKDLCHYLPAKRSAREYSRRFAPTLRTIKTRDVLAQDPRLASAALQVDDTYGDAHRLHEQVKAEQERIDRYASPWSDSGLVQELQRIYGLLEAQAARHEEVSRAAALKATADKVLAEEEQLRLEDYEVGLAMYARLKRGRVVTDAPKPDVVEPDEVVYPFDGEYWNDELHDYHLFITTRCLEQEAVQ